jgi:hypothetical protein
MSRCGRFAGGVAGRYSRILREKLETIEQNWVFCRAANDELPYSRVLDDLNDDGKLSVFQPMMGIGIKIVGACDGSSSKDGCGARPVLSLRGERTTCGVFVSSAHSRDRIARVPAR